MSERAFWGRWQRLIFSAFAGSGMLILSPLPSALAAKTSFQPFSIRQAPATKDWLRFGRLAPAQRRSIWRHYRKQGYELKDWSWGWRIGWMRGCRNDRTKFCRKMLLSGLQDKALVVRAEAATNWGERYRGSAHREAVNTLRSAFQNPKNQRHRRPLFIQQRILFAIHQIGGPYSQKVGWALAKSQQLDGYWRALVAATDQ